MNRREFFGLAGAMAAVGPDVAMAQKPPAVARVGVLWHAASAEEEDVYLRVLKKAFDDLGYIEGKNLLLEHRFPAEQADRFRSMAQELISMKLDAVIAVTEIAAREIRQASRTIPVVVVLSPDPVAAGLIESLARPGGNVTGLSLMAVDLSGKRVALLKEIIPNLSRLALMVDAKDPASRRIVASATSAAKSLGIELLPIEVNSPDSIASALATLETADNTALLIGPGSMMFNERARIGTALRARNIPTEVAVAEMVPYGPLLSYGPDFPDYFRRAVGYTDKILRGAKPADLPVEQPSRFQLTINIRAAKSLGLTIPPSLLSTANEVIE
jgi:putative ABC transport system substrate-binding protein